MRLVVATRNRGKLAEIAAALAGLGLELLGLDAFADAPEVVEDGATFEENALKKARQIAAATNCLTLADDSGLEVAALGGRPGVYSARFAGPGATDAANNDRLLRELHSVPDERRQATFRCVLAVCTPEGRCATCQGALRGAITREPRGDYGFGYDPLFVPEGFSGRTISELGAEVKAAVSHRAQALAQVRGLLPQFLGNSGA
jgi:XTP/dITP diphosphohydrolase